MFICSVYNENEKHLGYLGMDGKLGDKAAATRFTSRRQCIEYGYKMEEYHIDWYTEAEEVME